MPAARLAAALPPQDPPRRTADAKLLRMRTWPLLDRSAPPLRLVDLFAGAGGMSLGAFLAARDRGLGLEVVLAAEKDPAVARIYQANFEKFCASKSSVTSDPIESLLDGDIGAPLTLRERRLRRAAGEVDLLVGGPPCQGNSDLNNHTRRNDSRNPLYEKMARAAQVFLPRAIVIENVPAVVHARARVVDRTEAALHLSGYATCRVVLTFNRLGVPQARRRHVLLGVRGVEGDVVTAMARALERGTKTGRDVRWAIADLVAASDEAGCGTFDAPSKPSKDNEKRLRWFDRHQGAWILPDPQRPACHRNGGHSYKSIYGRLRWNHPAQTITTGFGSMGQGCYVHPSELRTITPHEAARLQTFPDFFDFSDTDRRTVWAKAIGNAVPPFGMREVVATLLPALE